MLKKLTLVAVAASVVLGSVGVGTAANAAPAKPAVAKVAVTKTVAVNRFAVLRVYAQDQLRLNAVAKAVAKAKGSQKTNLVRQEAVARAASNAWFKVAYTKPAPAAKLNSLRNTADREVAKAYSLALQVR